MTSTLSLNKRWNLSQTNFSNQCEQTGRHTHTQFVHILVKETLKGTPPFLCSGFSAVHCINPTSCRYILQSRQGHCEGTHFLIFLLKILKDCDNLISMGTRSHISGPRNEMGSVPCLTECTLRLFAFRQKLYGRETGTNIFYSGWTKTMQDFVNFYNKFLYVSLCIDTELSFSNSS